MNNALPASLSRSFQILEGNNPYDTASIELSGPDLEMIERIEEIVRQFSSKLGFEKSTLVLSPSYKAPSFSNYFHFFQIPTCCFSEETAREVDRKAVEKSGFSLPEKMLPTLKEMVSTERALFSSFTPDEFKWIIGHELGHRWLNIRLRAFPSNSMLYDEKKVADFKHDRAQEKVCDFIGICLSSQEAALGAMTKMLNTHGSDPYFKEPTHPTYSERVEYIVSWKNHPRLQEELTESLVLEIGGPDFQEAAALYKQYGRDSDSSNLD